MPTSASPRKAAQIEAEAALDGIYVLRTSVPAAELAAPDVVSLLQAAEVGRAGLPHLQGAA